jgi:Tfp pilus assembly protein FimT
MGQITIVELLIIGVIIMILISLLLPAGQSGPHPRRIRNAPAANTTQP